MKTEPKAMREIHKIREEIFEEMQRMTPEEWTEKVNRDGEEIAKRYGLKIQKPMTANHA